MNIVLVGFMGTGKTVISKAIGEKLHLRVINLDDEIEKRAKKSISQIFQEDGEPAFRELEKRMVEKFSQFDNLVIDAGGGVVLDEDNIRNLKKKGLVVCLTASAEVILRRTEGYIHRPLLEVDNPRKKIEKLLQTRAPYYAKADFALDTSDLTVEEAVEEIIKRFLEKSKK